MTGLVLLGYVAAVFMGLALGLTGGGGSILTVPILVYLFEIGAIQATAYSLLLVGLVALWGAWGAYRNGELHWQRALAFGVPGVLGVVVSRRFLLPLLPTELSLFGLTFTDNSMLLILFSLLMLVASVSMIRASRSADVNVPMTGEGLRVSQRTLFFSGLVVGLLAGFVGAGGGFLIVPALVNVGKLDMKQAVGTSLFVIASQSLLGVLGDVKALAQMDLVLFSIFIVLALLGMSLGTLFRRRISQEKLKLGFGVFVLIVGSLILVQEFRKGFL